jgi:regulator of sirC expression with transglutaminase-like and TPR domain
MTPELREFHRALSADPEFDLARAALLLARIEYPTLDPAPYLRRLDELAFGAGVLPSHGHRRALDRLRRFLFEEEGFRGNAERYFDPRNSCLNDVLDQKVGIPITLAVLTMEVGRRVGLPMHGLGLPGHFMVAADVDGERLILDPFNRGAMVSREDAGEVVARALGQPVPLTDAHFVPTSKEAIVTRMLANLKSIYVQQENWTKALQVIERLLLLEGTAPMHLRDRGTVLMKLGDFHRGAADWERYLTRYPHARDAAKLRDQLKRIRQALASLN